MTHLDQINGVLYQVPSGKPLGIPKRHLAVFGVTRDSGKTTFVEAAVAASGMRAIVFRTKRGEIGFENAKPLPLFFDERGLTHWKALEGLVAATLDEKVQREPGVRYAFMTLCKEPTQAQTLQEIYDRVVEKLKDPKLREWPKEIFTKVKNYLEEVLPQLKRLEGRFTNRLELPEPGVYVEDLVGLSDELQNLFVASLIRKVYEEFSGVIVVVAEIWKFLPQDRGSPVKWVIEKYVREMGVVEGWLWLDAQDLRGVDKKHLRSFDVRLFGRQPDAHEIDEILKALPLPKQQKPKPEQIMTLKLGYFYAKLKDKVELVYVRPVWLPESVAIRVAKGELEPDSEEVQQYKPKPSQSLEDDEMYKERYEQLEREFEQRLEQERHKLAVQAQEIVDKRLHEIAETYVSRYELKETQKKLEQANKDLELFQELKSVMAKVWLGVMDIGVDTPTTTIEAPSLTIAEVDERINQRISSGPEPIPVVSIDVDQRIKELVKNDIVSRLVAKIQSLPKSAKKAALWLHEKKQTKIGDLYYYLYEKTGRIPGSFYSEVINPLQDALMVINETGNIRWVLEEKLAAELRDVLRNGDVQNIAKYLTSLLL